MSLIFVYGNLKKGFGSHARHMQSARFIASTQTADNVYTLMAVLDEDATAPYPALIAGGNAGVLGEIYDVDDDLLARLDAYEGTGYKRRDISLKDGQSACTYFFVNPGQYPVTQKYPQIRTHSENPAILEWIKPS
ncbi:MAG: gamma-glutamylcyclotransferase [Alphaproteobacteria bacterium]|nr:gamma-glutamylcyclotransferase [Alphaproteobacteria bacterium]